MIDYEEHCKRCARMENWFDGFCIIAFFSVVAFIASCE